MNITQTTNKAPQTQTRSFQLKTNLRAGAGLGEKVEDGDQGTKQDGDNA